VPPNDRGLLARLDALVALAADRHGLALMPDGRLGAGGRSWSGTLWRSMRGYAPGCRCGLVACVR
jgi:hypothetical protein